MHPFQPSQLGGPCVIFPAIQRGLTPFSSWYAAGSICIYSYSTFVAVADKMYAIPFSTKVACNVEGIAIRVTVASGAGTRCRLGIYKCGGVGAPYPTTLLQDFGSVLTDSTGVKSITGLTCAIQAYTLYHAIALFESTPTFRAPHTEDFWGAWGCNNTGTGSGRAYITADQAYGALPANYSVVNPACVGGTYQPGVFLRFT